MRNLIIRVGQLWDRGDNILEVLSLHPNGAVRVKWHIGEEVLVSVEGLKHYLLDRKMTLITKSTNFNTLYEKLREG